MPSPGTLHNVRIKRVALVDSGANFDKKTGDGAHIMLFKRDTSKNSPSLGSVHVDTTDERDEYEKGTLSSEARNALPDSAFAAVWTDAKGKKHRKLPIHNAGHLAAARGRIDEAQIPAHVKAEARRKIEAKTKKEKNVKKSILKQFLGLFSETDETKRAEGIAQLSKAVADDDEDDDEDDAPVHKANDAMCKCADCMAKRKVGKSLTEIEKKNEDLEKRNTNLEKSLKETQEMVAVEIAKRETSEMTEVLKSFKATPFNIKPEDKDNDIVKFMAMKKADPKGFDRLMELFKANDAQMAASAAFANMGTNGNSIRGDAWKQLEKKAEQIMEKGTEKLTKAQAMERAMDENPKLVAQYRAEQN